jgi:Uma2 family endonuclease
MAGAARVKETISLEEFLRLPEIDEPPYLEYLNGRVEAKAAPQKQHCIVTARLSAHLTEYADAEERGLAFPNLRWTFGGRSTIGDVVFLLNEHIETDARGEISDFTFVPPDIHVEILSPGRWVRKSRGNLTFALANGCPLGWLIDLNQKAVYVYRPDRRAERLPDDGALDGHPVLPGYRLSLAQLFGWLKLRKPNPPDPQGRSRPSGGAPRR